jgi:hypothetical protein
VVTPGSPHRAVVGDPPVPPLAKPISDHPAEAPTEPAADTRRAHLLIAGTGRAGTSFLVRYLTALGMDTTLSRAGAAAHWDDDANAGLEALPLPGQLADLPHVIKTPWAYEVTDALLAQPQLRLQAAILPVRDLVDAATSRTVLELRALHQHVPWMAELGHTWETWGHTPGGAVYSLSPVDQARLLATGFHRLVERLTTAEVPMLFLAFPRFVRDADYLFDQLRSVLPAGTTRDAARAAHAATADAGKVRVDQERAALAMPSPAAPAALGATPGDGAAAITGPSFAELDRVALGREVARLRVALAATQQAAEQARQADAALQAEAARCRDEAARCTADAAHWRTAFQAEQAQRAELQQTVAHLRQEARHQRAAALRAERRNDALARQLAAIDAEQARFAPSRWPGRLLELVAPIKREPAATPARSDPAP